MINAANVFLPWSKLADLLVPPGCPVCRTAVASDDGLCVACWQHLHFITGPVCRLTGLPMPVDLGAETISPLARARPPPYTQARAAFGRHTLALQAVARIRPMRRQIGLSRAGRKRNLRGAFAEPAAQRHKVKGRAVVIVDDVLTTGATVEAMARILRQAGAGPIYVVTAARVVLPERA